MSCIARLLRWSLDRAGSAAAPRPGLRLGYRGRGTPRLRQRVRCGYRSASVPAGDRSGRSYVLRRIAIATMLRACFEFRSPTVDRFASFTSLERDGYRQAAASGPRDNPGARSIATRVASERDNDILSEAPQKPHRHGMASLPCDCGLPYRFWSAVGLTAVLAGLLYRQPVGS